MKASHSTLLSYIEVCQTLDQVPHPTSTHPIMLSTTTFKVLTALGLVSTLVSAAAVESRQQGNSDDAVLFSPSNGTSVAAGQSISFDYLCDDSETTTIDVALIRYEVVSVPSLDPCSSLTV